MFTETTVTMKIEDHTAISLKSIFETMQIELQRLEDKIQERSRYAGESSSLHILKMLADMGREITDPTLFSGVSVDTVNSEQPRESLSQTKELKASDGIESIDGGTLDYSLVIVIH